MKPLNPCDVALLNGPNLNLLGTREPEVYGADTLKSIEAKMIAKANKAGLKLDCRQTNFEGELVSLIQQMKSAGTTFLIINAAAYTHTSIAIRDAIAAVDVPFIEVHLSNIYQREQFRHHSYLSERAEAVICGFGAMGYDVALDYVTGKLRGSL
ncbi:MAG: type II 3-dehydroquinate dehydratase [Betaproteobacteria bacterium]|nr:type II 3-dehydroquinate dehydratase [Betaproteobacteria bacterium]